MTRLNNEEGLSEVIGFIMILALIMVFLSIWVVYGVPSEGRQQEIEHMDYVQDWFTQYKITADSLWINYDDVNNYGTGNITLSNSLVLGSLGGATHSQGLFMVLMRPFGSSGTISLEEDGSEFIEIKNTSATILNESMMRIQYDSSNLYWIPQSYYYQMGGVFLRQTDGTVCRIAPLISFSDNSEIANILITDLKMGGSDMASISGEGPVRIDTVITGRAEAATVPAGLGHNITITLKDESAAKAWMGILRELGAPSGGITRGGPDGNLITISGVDTINYQRADYTVSLQSVVAAGA
ncbi:hypothetical protein [Methanoplanus limicola]|uniref:Uncharacterized protein n=1 Tax=Methanoplanus limicola DSM 2279 TaxID=937775 RepID=H1YWB3_9EURY|nr:hypothetical protein [Methanoplanus limicola]EHQ34835.1 hypothetical protein Metlim_0712 [Methanoplanus limicola DSM 2279]